MVKPDKKALEAGLAEARKNLERYPNAWTYLETAGRILRYLNDPEAAEYFRKAIAHYHFHPKLGERDPDSNIQIGNLYWLSGDEEEALRYFQRARELYANNIQEYSDPAIVSMYIAHMIEACFLVKRDEEVADWIERLRVLNPSITLRAYPIAKLSAARRTQDVKLAAEAVDEFARRIRRERVLVWDTGGVSLWDWYEIAMKVLQDLSGQEINASGS